MANFLMIGLLRDRSRSLFPILIVTAGVGLTVLAHAWISGVLGDVVETNAQFQAGHMKVVTKTFFEESHQSPVELAVGDLQQLLNTLATNYPTLDWMPRIHFGGLLDIPDEEGETIAQGPVVGLAVDLFTPTSQEIEFLNLKHSLITGNLPQQSGEILVSHAFFEKLQLSLGKSVTLISSGMEGGMAVYNFTIVGTVKFGITGMDRGAMIADVYDVQEALNMMDAASEILGFFQSGFFQEVPSDEIVNHFNQNHALSNDPFAPFMLNFKQSDIGQYFVMADGVLGAVIGIFLFIMSVVLWNTGIMGGIRRYGEMGVRLALGETKHHIYLTLLAEALIVGLIGSLIGTVLALMPAFYLQEYGLDVSDMMQDNTGIMMSTTMRAQITDTTFWIGLVPGLAATTLGALISGLTIYKRQTAELFKELEI